MKKILNVMQTVEIMLMQHKRLRDNDDMLMANIWYHHIGPSIKEMTAMKLLEWVANKNVPSYESVSRARRKLQEKDPSLRGDKWEERHKRAAKIKKEIVG
tara:strand:+ start:196 stop:495 length:300 start_codon:yes stop_codon:yes gene_type:complete